jgi:NAD(P)-dependent dehydrogenase (short-subunit alcohol dehydrogenase family)
MVGSPEIPRGWDEANIADLAGKRFLVTGGTSGLGLATATALTKKGARVTITARNVAKGHEIVAQGFASDVLGMDLADLASVRDAASRVSAPYDVVILNAGVMWTPYTLTTDGLELQMATNHLGHFAFAGLIKDCISERLVTVTSLYHRRGSFGDGSVDEIRRRCQGLAAYSTKDAYGDSKLANVLFTQEIERRRVAAGWKFIALNAHPGWANTNLFDVATAKQGVMSTMASRSNRYLAQSAARGALPQLCAATFPGLVGGEYLGPRGPGELRGTPTIVRSTPKSYDVQLASNLWMVSQKLTGVSWDSV